MLIRRSVEGCIGPVQQLSFGKTALNPSCEIFKRTSKGVGAVRLCDSDGQVVDATMVAIHGFGVNAGQSALTICVLVDQKLTLRPDGIFDLLNGGELHGMLGWCGLVSRLTQV